MTDPVSIGTTIDADLAAIKTWIAKQEAAAEANEKKVTTWLRANWLHIVNAGGIGATILKLFGKL